MTLADIEPEQETAKLFLYCYDANFLMEKLLETAEVARCTVPECVYNRAGRCYALAITVGNGDHPQCDTFYAANGHVPKRSETAGVGACKVFACRHNDNYKCGAVQIYVGYDDADHYLGCLTYSRLA